MKPRRKINPSKVPGVGDVETWSRIVRSANDPRYVEHEVLCSSCDGTGKESEEDIPCWFCNGDGVIMKDNIGEIR